MKNMLFATVLAVFFALACYGQAQTQTLAIDASVDQSKIDLQMWYSTVLPEYLAISTPSPTQAADPKINIMFADGLNGAVTIFDSNGGRILFGVYPHDKTNISDDVYRMLTHELMHWYAHGAPVGGAIEEGLAESKTSIIYRRMHVNNPNIIQKTSIWMQDTLNNLPRNTISSVTVWPGYWYSAVTSQWELLVNKTGGNFFKPIDQVRNRYDLKAAIPWSTFLNGIDNALINERIDGVLPSTFMDFTPGAIEQTEDGTFFGIFAAGSPSRPGWTNSSAPVNPTGMNMFFFSSQNNIITHNAGRAKYAVSDASGKVVISGTVDIPATFFGIGLDTTSLAEGGYRLDACIVVSAGDCDQKLKDTSYFLIDRSDWTRGSVFVITNGSNWGELKSQSLNVVSGSFTDTKVRPGYVRYYGVTGDLVLTDGTTTRTFTPDWDLSTINLWTRRDQPALKGIVNGASLVPSTAVVPGSIYNIQTWGATQGDPEWASKIPLPVKSCGERTRAVFTGSDGKSYDAPFFYCSRNLLEIQVPQSLVGPTAKVKVVLGNAETAELTVSVADADPGIFLADPANSVGAVIFQNGQVVDANHPAHPGDYLSIYATGLGTVSPAAPPDGYVALVSPLSMTTNVVSVGLSSGSNSTAVPTLFAGLAPYYAGLHQINFRVPTGLAAGTYDLTISIKNKVSNVVKLAISK